MNGRDNTRYLLIFNGRFDRIPFKVENLFSKLGPTMNCAIFAVISPIFFSALIFIFYRWIDNWEIDSSEWENEKIRNYSRELRHQIDDAPPL